MSLRRRRHIYAATYYKYRTLKTCNIRARVVSLNRRHDHTLRSAIDKMQENLGLIRDSRDLYLHALEELKTLSHSSFGFIVEPVSSHNRAKGYRNLVDSCYIYNEASNLSRSLRKSEFSFLYRAFLSSNPEVYSQIEIADAQSVVGAPKGMSELLAIPVADGKDVFAVICLSHSSERYSPLLAKRFWPLISAAIFIRRELISRVVNQSNIYASNQYEEKPKRSNDTLSRIQRSCPIGIIEINQNHKIVRLNPAAEIIFGLSEQDAVEREIVEFIPERFPNEHRIHNFTNQDSQTKLVKTKFVARRFDKTMVPVDIVTVSQVVHGQTHYLLMIQDQSDLENAKVTQDSQLQKFKAVSDLAPVGILQTDRHWKCTYANDRWCEICRMDIEEVLGKGWINAIYYEDIDATLRSLHITVDDGNEFKRECRFRTRLGEIVWVDLQARPLFGALGAVEGLIITLSDVTYRHVTEEKLRMMAELDGLTGLVNRNLFQDRLGQAIARIDRHGAIALLCVDLDDFKSVNDSLGHDAGDKLLKEVAKRLSYSVRTEDTVARVGGDEFMILIEGVSDPKIAATVSSKIVKNLSAPIIIAMQEVFTSASIGISFCVKGQEANINDLMKQADIALYRAKEQGRNNYQYYSPELEQASRERLSLSNNLHRALQREEFEIYYQFQANVDTGEIMGVEALLRWNHSQNGLLCPDKFIPLLEQTGLIEPVGRWLIQQSISTFKQWFDEGLFSNDSHISINLSPKQLRNTQIISVFNDALNESGLDGNSVIAEITESSLLDGSPAIRDTLIQIKDLGVKIALDDFGTGYSSLTYLKRFPIDVIKIDRSFVQNILNSSEDAVITQAVITLAKSLNLGVIAEGVETADQLKKLAEWGCTMHQGYLLNRPKNASEITAMLQSSEFPLSANAQ